VETLSDHKYASFGENYGVLIKELRLLNRAIFIVDKNDKITYIEMVEENHDHPDYDEALDALKSAE
jgi:thiol peroxidase